MKTILVAPLNWGLGHASRCIPLIAHLLNMGHRVVLAGDGASLQLLHNRFGQIETIHLPSYSVRYSARRSQLLPMLWLALRLPLHNWLEHLRLQRIIRSMGIDLVLSDNRYGLWSKHCPCVLIAHQLRVIPPQPFAWAERFTSPLLRRWMRHFSAVWVPDNAETPLAGRLSAHNGLRTIRHIGTLSRFALIDLQRLPPVDYDFELLVIASGPPPHRQLLIDAACTLAQRHNLRCLIVAGNPAAGCNIQGDGTIRHVGHLPDTAFAAAVLHARYLLFRGGYSSIMDMLTLGVVGLMIPTPGQTEQEYIAQHLNQLGILQSIAQQELPNATLDALTPNALHQSATTH
ncbi:MAG: hypothetical protein IKI28_06270 [Bacteroidales bacterium]|nr:hypothetical protein [Bacteroidales bacterium]